MKRKMLALAGALVLAACPLTACGEASSNENMTMDEMPYGASLTANTSLPVTVQYDNRYLEDGLAQKISAYYHALQEQDAAEFTSTLLPFFHEYQLEDTGSKKLTDEELVKLTYDSVKEEIEGKDFDYSMVDVVEYIDADKLHYPLYYDLVIEKVAQGGLILADNVLWDGKVVDPRAKGADTQAIREFNDKVMGDPRVEQVLLPLRDGLMMARKL